MGAATTITGRSAVILRQHTTPFRPMIVLFDDLELVYQSLRTLEPPHTHKFPRVNAQDCKLGPIPRQMALYLSLASAMEQTYSAFHREDVPAVVNAARTIYSVAGPGNDPVGGGTGSRRLRPSELVIRMDG